MYRKHLSLVKIVFLGVRASCKALPIYIAFRAKDEVRLGIGLRGHRAYLTFLRTAISRLEISQRTLRCKSA